MGITYDFDLVDVLKDIRVRFNLNEDFESYSGVIDMAIKEINSGIYGRFSDELYCLLASNRLLYLYKYDEIDFTDWLSLLTNAELCLLEQKSSSLVIHPDKTRSSAYNITYHGLTGSVSFDEQSGYLDIALDGFRVSYIPPKGTICADTFNSPEYFLQVKSFLDELVA